MNRRTLGASFLLIASCLLASCVRVIKHDPTLAAASADRFAQVAFIEKDYQKAYSLLAPEAQRTLSVAKLEETIVTMHPSGTPVSVASAEFEPIPGQRAMHIFLNGTNEQESFYYRLIMIGDRASGYRVGGLWRGNGPYPPSSRKPL